MLMVGLTITILGGESGRAQDAAPPFPKIGSEYVISLPHKDGMGPPFFGRISQNLLIERWLGGSWYRVAYSIDGKNVKFTNLNTSVLLTLTEQPEEWSRIKDLLTRKSESVDTPNVESIQTATLMGTWSFQFNASDGKSWTVSTRYDEDGTFSSAAICLEADDQGLNEPIVSRGKWSLEGGMLTTVILESSETKLTGKTTKVTALRLTKDSMSYVDSNGKSWLERR